MGEMPHKLACRSCQDLLTVKDNSSMLCMIVADYRCQEAKRDQALAAIISDLAVSVPGFFATIMLMTSLLPSLLCA